MPQSECHGKNIEQVLSSFDVIKMLAQVTTDQKNIMHDLRVRKNFDSIPLPSQKITFRPRRYEDRFTSDEMKDTPHFKVNFLS